MKPETIQDLINRSTTLLDVAANLPIGFINVDLLRNEAYARQRLLLREEERARVEAEESKKATALALWATQVHVSLRTYLDQLPERYAGVKILQNGYDLFVRAPGWDKWKDEVAADYSGILATVEPFRSYTSHNKTRVWHKQDETHEGNFVNLTIAGKKSRLTKPNFRNIAMLIETAVRENQDFITRRLQEKEERLKKASTVTELFGDIIPVIEEKKESTYRPDFGSRRRETQVFHSIETRITPVGVLSGGTIRPHDNGTYSISVNFNALDVETAKRVLAALKAIQ